MEIVKIEVNQKINNKYQVVGTVDIFVPTLEEVGVGEKPEQAVDAEGKAVVEDGLPVYKDARHNFILDCIVAATKAKARNKLVPKTANVKPGQTIASTLEALMAEGERVGNPDALAAIREAKADFALWTKGLGKSANAQTTLNTLFSNRPALFLQTSDNKQKMAQYVEDFSGSLDEAKLARYMKYLESVLVACEVGAEVDDF